MTTRAFVNTDSRMIAAGLIANLATTDPAIITATGRVAPTQCAQLPPGAWGSFALLPNVDYDDDPDRRPGCGFIGGRHASNAPLLAPAAIAAPANVTVKLRSLPDTRDEILRELRGRAGLWSAPGALFARVGWPDTFVTDFVNRLRENGDPARLCIAVCQAGLATRKAWLAVEWTIGGAMGASLATASGIVAAGRALIDAIALVDRLAMPKRTALTRPAERETALGALLMAFNHFLRHARAAQSEDQPPAARKRLMVAVGWARTIVDAIGVFSVAADDDRMRWQRLASMLEISAPIEHAGGAAVKLARLERELEQLSCAQLGNRLQATCWRPHIRRALLRLASPDRASRMRMLQRIRCDLIFKLAMTRRLRRLYRLFPWLAAPHGAFPECAGGALGALASLYEAARAVEIGCDMKRRLSDAGQRRGMVARVTARQARTVYANSRHVVLAAGRNYAAGAALVGQVTSHVMVRAALHGRRFAGNLSLEAVRWCDLGYNDAAALKVKYTRNAVLSVQQAQPVFHTASTDDDLVRHMGMTLVGHLGAAVHMMWPTRDQRTNLVIARLTVHFGKRPTKGDRGWPTGPWNNLSKFRVHQELVRSMLHAVDGDPGANDGIRDAITDLGTPETQEGELGRASSRQEKPSRKTGAWDEHDIGQSAARLASRAPTASSERGAALRDLIDDARRWRPFDRKKLRPAPQDDFLEDILLGRANLAQLAPVSDLFEPMLWFAPLIDRDRLAWLASGMSGQASGGNDDPLAARVKSWIDAVRGWSWAPFASPIVPGRDDVIACHLFTGVSSVTADLGHVR